MQKFKVIRPHDGDKFYNAGDVREAKLGDVKHLIPITLQPIDDEPADVVEEEYPETVDETKAETVHFNKAEKASAKNK